ncbi:MAG: RNA 2',3'-cyclic phosphodiesterase, partial [Acidobacteriota bacterium]|nr:RNA 2',3'-cyclic phosphodiesterase [Acidobacteriota bacterium]
MSRPAQARLFIALDLPVDVRHDLAAWARRALGTTLSAPGARGVPPSSMHLTLCFLGTVSLQSVAPLAAVVEREAPPPMTLSLGAPVWLPRRRPRALAVEVHEDSDALAALHRDIVQAIREVAVEPGSRGARGAPPREARPAGFRPHVTVARMRQGVAPRERPLPATPSHAFPPPAIVL